METAWNDKGYIWISTESLIHLFLCSRAREEHVLISADGPHSNVIKIKPPLVFSYEDADLLVNTIDKCLAQIEDARS